MPIGKIEAFDETNNDWICGTCRAILLRQRNQGQQASGRNAKLNGKQNVWITTQFGRPAKPSSLYFKTIVETLQKHLSPRPLLIAERFRFHKRNQLEGETVSSYLAELKKLLLYCEFGTNLNDVLRDRLVCGLHNELIQKRLLSEPDLSLQKLP